MISGLHVGMLLKAMKLEETQLALQKYQETEF